MGVGVVQEAAAVVWGDGVSRQHPGPNAINLRRLSAKTFFRQRDAVKAGVHSRALHDIGTQLPAKVWIAIPHKARSPVTGLPVRVVRFSGASLRYGIEDAEFEGVPVRITSPARTIVDCFRFRRIVGMDVALEAICDAVADRRVTPAQIRRAAEACRAQSLVRPVLQALVA